MTTPFGAALVAVAAVSGAMALQQVMIALRLREREAHLLFAVAAAAVAADAVTEMRLLRAATPGEFERLLAMTAVFICTFLAALAWYVAVRTGAARRWLLVGETAALVLTAGLEVGLPHGATYLRVEGFREITLPWDEVIRFAAGMPNPWRLVGDVANIGFMLYLLDTAVRLHRRGERRGMRLIGGSLLLFSASVLMIIPFDLGLLTVPPPHPFAFVLIVAVMGWDLSDSVARAATLSRVVAANERRWRQLLESVQLLVVGLDRGGRITSMNPFAEQVSGYSANEMVGRSYLDFVSEEEREQVVAAVEQGLRGDPQSENDRVLVRSDGTQRVVRWRSVVLRDSDGNVEGLLSVGADVTERRESEEAVRRTAAELERTVNQLEDLRSRLEEENLYLKEEVDQRHEYENIVGNSDPLLYVLHKVKKVAPSDASVLIQGETGVGKELVARAIHQESPRAGRSFVAVNCAALAPSLVESELFGHDKGAFTGADRRRRGRFELADGGTLFLDEVAELPLEVQPKLLRVLEDGELERVGGSVTHTVNVRLITATNRDLRAEVEAGRFREDLYYRLEVYPITVPPLRERREDIPILVRHFVHLLGIRHGVRVDEVPPEVLRCMEAYDWPGNVRELHNVVERAVLTSSDNVLRLASPLAAPEDGAAAGERKAGGRLATLEEVERAHIRAVLDACGGKISGAGGAAEVLGLHPNTLRSRLKKLGLGAGRLGKGASGVEPRP